MAPGSGTAIPGPGAILRRPIRRSERPVERPHRCRRCRDVSLSDHGGRHPFDTNLPPFEGLERFRGKWYRTSRFPRGGVDFAAKRVAVVGTGASAVQAIPEIAQQAKQLTVFQRTPNYCLPVRNGKVDPERVAAGKTDYDAIVERTRNSFAGFELARISKSALEPTPEEREHEFERMWTLAASSSGWARMCC